MERGSRNLLQTRSRFSRIPVPIHECFASAFELAGYQISRGWSCINANHDTTSALRQRYRTPARMQQMSTIAGLSRPFYRSSDISCLSLPHCIVSQRTSRSPPGLPLRYFICSKFFKSYPRSCGFVEYPRHSFLTSLIDLAGCTKSSELAESRCFGLGGGSRRSGQSRVRYGIWLGDGGSVLRHHV